MKTKIFISLRFSLCILLFFSTTACGGMLVRGRVVDAVTGQPIEKAAVYNHWWKSSNYLGMYVAKDIDKVECFTDVDGYFKIPKYSILKHYDLTIYKKGYVCWTSETIFPTYERRKRLLINHKSTITLKIILVCLMV